MRSGENNALRAWILELRPHQWAKNGLLLLPILAAHLEWQFGLIVDVVTGVTAFSLLASAGYVLNDLSDLDVDRSHPTKSQRPLASGDISVRGAVAYFVALVAASGLLALRLPKAFALSLIIYFILSLAYSWRLKQKVILDVVALAALYTVRVVAGAALAEIQLTGWFLAFSIFLFLSLALLKRVVELKRIQARNEHVVFGRGYTPADLPVLESFGPATAVVSALVYCLYITSSVRGLYSRPDLLWLGLPLFLYWIIRIWLLALRGEVDDDPVVFVLGDPTSYAVFLAFLLTVYVAA